MKATENEKNAAKTVTRPYSEKVSGIAEKRNTSSMDELTRLVYGSF